MRITLLAFVTKAVATTLGEFPTFNASLGPEGDTLVIKKYVHVGIAVDTPERTDGAGYCATPTARVCTTSHARWRSSASGHATGR